MNFESNIFSTQSSNEMANYFTSQVSYYFIKKISKEKYFFSTFLVTPKYKNTLWEILRKNDFSKLTIEERLEIIKKVAQGSNVEFGHHYDIKPTNIFLNEENGKWNGELVLADFGIGETYGADHGCGTGGFASPEQIVTIGRKEADIYSIAKGS